MSSFSGFKDGINFLRRRFSSNDLPNEPEDNVTSQETVPDTPLDSPPPSTSKANIPVSTLASTSSKGISAPCTPSRNGTMPARTESTITSSPSSKTSDGLSFAKSLFSRGSSKVSPLASHSFEACKQKVLLVVDDMDVQWSSHFVAKKVSTFDVKIEQFDFSCLCVTSSAVDGCVVHVKATNTCKSPFSRSFRPDFVLIRQKVRHKGRDYRAVVLSLLHGGVVCLQDPWTSLLFADVALLTCKLNEVAKQHNFPYIPGDFFCQLKDIHRKIQNGSIEYPIVLKLGNHNAAENMIKVENQGELESILSFTTGDQSFCFIQEFVSAEYEVIVYKIGVDYKAFSRTSLDGKWNVSSSKVVIEEIKMQDRYKEWLDVLSSSCGGMVVCGLQVLTTKCSKEFIIGAYDSTINFLGDKQDDDNKLLCNVALKHFEQHLKDGKKFEKISENTEKNNQRHNEGENVTETESSKKSVLKSLSKNKSKENKSLDEGISTKEEDSEDTMKNLRKTFAGIFGDM